VRGDCLGGCREFLGGWWAALIWPFAAKCTGDVPADSAGQRTIARITLVTAPARAAFICLATLHEESNCKDCDYHYHHGFNYCSQRHWGSPYISPRRAKGASQTFGRYEKNDILFCPSPSPLHMFRCGQSMLAMGCVRCRPVTSSHFSFGGAPQVGQRTAIICFGLSPALMEDIAPHPMDKNGQS